jgi:predicted N-formylglutamate amidohydrolase
MKGYERPWHVGVLTNVDRRMGDALMAALSVNKNICVGDNLPYSGMSPYGYTIETQAVPKGFPNVLIELRQDLIDTHHGAVEWASWIGEALEQVLRDRSLLTRFEA